MVIPRDGELSGRETYHFSALGIRAGGDCALCVLAVPSGCPRGTGPGCAWPFFLGVSPLAEGLYPPALLGMEPPSLLKWLFGHQLYTKALGHSEAGLLSLLGAPDLWDVPVDWLLDQSSQVTDDLGMGMGWPHSVAFSRSMYIETPVWGPSS